MLRNFVEGRAVISSKWVLVLVGIIAFSGGPVSGQTLLQDSFDGYADQAAFQAVWTTIGATPSGTLTSSQSVSAPNSINYATAAQRNERSFAESGLPNIATGNIVRFSFDFFDSNSGLAPYRQYANLQDGAAPSTSGQLISMGLNNNLTSAAEGGNFYMARILGHNTNAYFKLNDNPALLRSTGWHNLAVEISDADYRFFVDGALAETIPNTLTLRSYDVVRLGSGLSSTAEAFFDNVSVQAIPEPGTLALVSVAAVGLLSFRRRQK
ncbi:MAG: PEP-CTERM sorting domain-containing protein [Pirellulales bacterium]